MRAVAWAAWTSAASVAVGDAGAGAGAANATHAREAAAKVERRMVTGYQGKRWGAI